MKYIFLSIVCLIAGFFIGRLEWNRGVTALAVGSSTDSAQTLHQTIADQNEELQAKEALTTKLESRISELESDYALLSASIEAATQNQVETPAPANPFLEQVRKMSTTMTGGQHAAQLAKLTSALNLSPDQVKAIEDFYAEQDSIQERILEKLFQGVKMEEIQKDMIAEARTKAPLTLDQVLKDQLSPEQADAYENFKEIEKAERKEATVYRELADIQRSVTMSEEQKDAVFVILHEEKYKLSSDDRKALGIEMSSPESMLESKKVENERLLEALSGILDPTQLDIYKKQKEQELKMMEASASMMNQFNAK